MASIEGFDENMATEMQNRAKEYLERKEAELDERRRELGVEDELLSVPGVTTAMLVAFGENSIKTVEDLADCARDDLEGWYEKTGTETKHHTGVLEKFDLSRQEIEDLIMSARVVAGWVAVEDIVRPVAEEPAAEAATPQSEAEALFADRSGGTP